MERMNVFHISPIYNRESILTHGIIPTTVRNRSHLENMRHHGFCTKDDKAIYTWVDSLKNEKFIRDLIYAVAWIHPRNELTHYWEDNLNDWPDFTKMHRKPIWKFDQMLFDVYKVEAPERHVHYIHMQEPCDDPGNTICQMHDQYAHDDKDIIIYKETLSRIRIVGQASYSYDSSNDKIAIKVFPNPIS